MLADAVGEDLLDAVCASDPCDPPAAGAPLPRPDIILSEGWAILHKGLPWLFAPRFPDARGDRVAHAASERAVDVVLAL